MKFDIILNGIHEFYPTLKQIYYILKVDNSEKYHSSHIRHGGAPAQRWGVSMRTCTPSRGDACRPRGRAGRAARRDLLQTSSWRG